MSWGRGNTKVMPRSAGGIFLPTDPVERFREKCRFEPETGCVIWTGSKSWGRGKHIRYGSFRDGKKIWLAHRWAAKHIHGLDIEDRQVDHCCPNIPIPNTLCVEHLQVLTAEHNRWLQTERRRHFIHLEVGLLPYDEIYGIADEESERVPFYTEPTWLGGLCEHS